MVGGYLVEGRTEEEAQWSKRSGLQISNSVTAWRLKVLLEGRDPYRGTFALCGNLIWVGFRLHGPDFQLTGRVRTVVSVVRRTSKSKRQTSNCQPITSSP